MSQKDRFLQVVPWRNKEEWLQVYEKLFSTNHDDLEWAVSQVAVWQARCPASALLGVETTSGLVRARILDLNHTTRNTILDAQYEVSMVYAMALVRFVNLVCETCQSKAHVTPIRNIALRMGIPEWLVNLRHASTHKYSIPSLDMLRTGTSLALEWLRLNYWEKEVEHLNDFVLEGLNDQISIIDKIGICLDEFQKIQYSVLYGQKGKIQKINRSVLQSALKTLRSLIKKRPVLFLQVLSEPGHLVPKYHHLEAMLKPGENSFLDSTSIQLPHSLQKFWAPVFHLFSQSEHVECLLKFLLELSSPEDDFSERLAAAWALHILNVISSNESGLFLFIPNLNWLQLLEVALKQPTQYSPHVLTSICQNTTLSESTKQALMALVAIFLGSVTSSVLPKKIGNTYSLEDVMKIVPKRNNKASTEFGKWRNYSGKSDWQTCPLGCVIESPKELPVSSKSEDDDENILNKIENDPVITEPSEEHDMVTENGDQVEEQTKQSTSVKDPDLSMSLIFM